MKTAIVTPHAPKATGPFSQGILSEKFLFTSGQVHLTPAGKLLEGSIEEQLHQVMENLKAILETGGATFADVVKTTISSKYIFANTIRPAP